MPMASPLLANDPTSFAAAGNTEFIRADESQMSVIADLIGRCSRSSILERFHLPISTMPRGYFPGALADRRSHYAFLIRIGDRAVGLVELHSGAVGVGDVAMIIEDSSQGQRLGTQAFRWIARVAAAQGIAALRSTVRTDNQRLIRALLRAGGMLCRSDRHASEIWTALGAPGKGPCSRVIHNDMASFEAANRSPNNEQEE
jgi:hypothetical protein